MLWRKPKQCVVCRFYSRRGERIHGRFMCESCENEMVDCMVKEQEDREYAEIARISNQRFNDEYRA